MTIIAATGHRPDRLGGYDLKTRRALGALAVEYLARMRPTKVICGMALGWDQAVAGACVALDVPFVAAVPFPDQERIWPEEAQTRYRMLLVRAASVEIVCPEPVNIPGAMNARNLWMVDRAERIVALWDGTGSGTGRCVRYAQKRGLPIDNLWNRWVLPEEAWSLIG